MLLFSNSLRAQQDTLPLNVHEVIALAQSQSVSAVIAENQLQTAYWEYKSYKAGMLPEISIDGMLPNYRRSYNSYQHEDGSYSYVRSNNLSIASGVHLTQNIPFTGGQIQLGSSLNFTTQLGEKSTEFLSIPVELTLIQPIFATNTLKWDKQIEPLKYEEAQIQYTEGMERITLEAINYYFNFLLAHSTLTTAQQNLKNAQKLYEIGKAKKEIGELSKNELIQLEIEQLQSKAEVTEAESILQAQMFQLATFLGLHESLYLQLEVPHTIHAGTLLYEVVLEHALENSSFAKNILRRQKEVDYAVAIAKGNRRQVDLYASFGLTGIGNEVPNAYTNLADNQIVEVAVRIPILDWGKREAQVEFAKSNKAVEEAKMKEEELSFNQDVFLLVERFNNQAQQLQIAIESDKLAQTRYAIAMETFVSGEISILELNDARDSKNSSTQQLIEEMYRYWSYYYNVQLLTLKKMNTLLIKG